ncbi:hypothetical protein SESBI_38289 [Sesbania bispinosa]|nr:hypothetical protein SESBI_38289 [Sesbania bispinosa]
MPFSLFVCCPSKIDLAHPITIEERKINTPVHPLFENIYNLSSTEENKFKVYNNEFIRWVKPTIANDFMWEDTIANENGAWKTLNSFELKEI